MARLKRDSDKEKIKQEVTSEYFLMKYTVGPNQTGIRLDHFIMDHYRKRSRESIQRAIDDGSVTIERTQSPHLQVGKLKPSSQLVGGDVVYIQTERKPEPEANFNYKILYEDEFILVIEKPANLPVHPSGRYYFNTLLIHLKTKAHTIALDAAEMYYLAHRIDKETSGIMVLAKDSDSCAALVKQFAERNTEKEYLALVKGNPPLKMENHKAMNRSPTSKVLIKMVCMGEDEGGLPASTRFEKLETRIHPEIGAVSLVRCYPKTGRQHQIRVHLADLGFPLVGDKLYGVDEDFALLFFERDRLTPEAEAKLILPRHALHSCSLSFEHPKSKKPITFRNELPEDLMSWFTSLKLTNS